MKWAIGTRTEAAGNAVRIPDAEAATLAAYLPRVASPVGRWRSAPKKYTDHINTRTDISNIRLEGIAMHISVGSC